MEFGCSRVGAASHMEVQKALCPLSCVCVALVQSAPSVSVLLLPFLGYQNGTPSWESRSLQPWLGVAIGVVKG